VASDTHRTEGRSLAATPEGTLKEFLGTCCMMGIAVDLAVESGEKERLHPQEVIRKLEEGLLSV